MDERVHQALAIDRTIDITTTGRSSGLPRRIETWFYRVDDQIYMTGSPGRRDWYANLLANPDFTFHLKQSVGAEPRSRNPDHRSRVEAHDLRTHPLGPGRNRGSGGLVSGESADGGRLQGSTSEGMTGGGPGSPSSLPFPTQHPREEPREIGMTRGDQPTRWFRAADWVRAAT